MTFLSTPIGELTNIKTGKLDANASSPDGAYPFFTCAREPLKIDRWQYDLDAVLVAGNGDLNVKHYHGKFEAYQRTYIINSKSPEKLHTRYLFHFLDLYVQQLRRQSIGGIIKFIKLGMLTDAEIPLPPLDEQKRIAAILDKADAIRRKREQALALADDFLRSIYVHRYSYKHPNYDGWTEWDIEQLAKPHKGAMRTGPFGSDLRHSEFVDEGIAVLGIDNAVQNRFAWAERRFITAEKYEKLGRYKVSPGDVIITIMGTTGRSAVVPDDIPEAITTKHLATISCDKDKVIPEFLSYAIHSDPLLQRQILQANKGAIMAGLNLGIIKSLKIKLPDITEQKNFRDTLIKMERTKDRILSDDGSGRELFASLSQRAFRGEL